MIRTARAVFAPVFSFAFVGVLLVGTACSLKPKAGDKCEKGTAACVDATSELTCQDGKLFAIPCKGASGCKTAGTSVTCDVSGNVTGDVCSSNEEGVGDCSADKQSMVTCVKGAYKVTNCRGKNACVSSAGKLTCDTSLANLGDACDDDGDACSVDGKSMLTCRGGKMVLDKACRGAKGCRVEGTKAACDVSIAEAGDACTGAGAACSVDGKEMLACTNGKLAVSHVCRGQGGCTVSAADSSIACGDMTVSTIGDDCLGEQTACSVDHTHATHCVNGKIVALRTCKCTVKNDEIFCGG